MSAMLKQVIENIEHLSAGEKAMIAHCLISSLEGKHDDSVDEAWGKVAQQRFSDLESRTVRGVSWCSIKNKVTQ